MVVETYIFTFSIYETSRETDELPDLQRAILRVLFHAPMLKEAELWERIYYPTDEVRAAIETMLDEGYLRPGSKKAYHIRVDLLAQMQAKQDDVSAKLTAGIANLKQMLADEQKRRDEENS